MNYPVFGGDKGKCDIAEDKHKKHRSVLKRVQIVIHPRVLDATKTCSTKLYKPQGYPMDGRKQVLEPEHPWTHPPVSH